jgi:hypothetical protein
MNTQPHTIDARASRGLVAAVVLIVGFGVLALVARIDPPAGWGQLPSSGGATEIVAEFGD